MAGDMVMQLTAAAVMPASSISMAWREEILGLALDDTNEMIAWRNRVPRASKPLLSGGDEEARYRDRAARPGRYRSILTRAMSSACPSWYSHQTVAANKARRRQRFVVPVHFAQKRWKHHIS